MSTVEVFQEKRVEGIEFDLDRLAELFVETHRDKIAYVPDKRSFFVYNGAKWESDPERIAVSSMAGSFCRDLRDYLWAAGNQGDRAKYPERFLNSLSSRRNLLDESRAFCLVPWSRFDANPYLFNFVDGTYNFASGQLMPHKPSDYITRIGGAWYRRGDPEESERARQFLDNFIGGITEGNEDLAGHLQRCAGYGLFGDNELDLCFFGHGPSTRNGKSTFANLLRAVFGEYAVTTDASLFDQRKSKGLDAREMVEKGQLGGARLAIVQEPDKDAILNASLLKSVTGGEPIKGTDLYSAQRDISSGVKIWFFSNHCLRLHDPTVLDSRRMVYVPFPHHFSPAEQKPELERLLLQEAVLTECAHWLIKGAVDAIDRRSDMTGARGLDASDRFHGNQGIARLHCDLPEAVRAIYEQAMTSNYSGDGVDDFLERCVIHQAGSRVPVQRLLESYKEFCSADPDAYSELSDIDFRRRIGALLDVRNGHGGVKVARDIALLSENQTAANI